MISASISGTKKNKTKLAFLEKTYIYILLSEKMHIYIYYERQNQNYMLGFSYPARDCNALFRMTYFNNKNSVLDTNKDSRQNHPEISLDMGSVNHVIN